MKEQEKPTVWSRLFPIGLALWFLLIVLDYLFHHPYFGEAIADFHYGGLLLLMSFIIGASWYSFFRLPEKGKLKSGIRISGLAFYLLLLVLMIVVFAYYNFTNELFTTNPISHLVYFSTLAGSLHLIVFCFFLVCFAVGESFLFTLRNHLSLVSQRLLSLGIGISMVGISAVILGLFGFFKPGVIWALIAVVLILRYQSIWKVLEAVLLEPMKIRVGVPGLLTALVGMIFLAVNLVGAIKAFPIGFDGANLYLNTSKLIGEYQGLTQGGQAYNWSVIMSFGYLLFDSPAVAILLAHLPSVLCVLVLFRIGKIFMSSEKSLLAAVLFYTAPYISFHNLTDEKVDLGFLFISLCTILLLLEYYQNKQVNGDSLAKLPVINWGDWSLSDEAYVWILAGWLTGFAFGIKYIALINFIAILAYCSYLKAGRFAFGGQLLTAVGVIFLLGLDRFSGISMEGASPSLIAGVFLVPGLILLGLAFAKNRIAVQQLLFPVLLFGLTFTLAFAPWMIKNIGEHQSFSINHLIEGKSPRPEIIINPDFINQKESNDFRKLGYLNSPPKQNFYAGQAMAKLCQGQEITPLESTPSARLVYQQTPKKLNAAEQARREELQRYLGFESGLPLYLSLPYDLTMNVNFPDKTYLDIGFLFLLILPLLFFGNGVENQKKNIALLIVFELILLIAIGAAYGGLDGFDHQVASQEIKDLIAGQPAIFAKPFGAVYYGLMSLLFLMTSLLTPLLNLFTGMNIVGVMISLLALTGFLYWASRPRLQQMPKGFKAFCSLLLACLFIWLLLGNGIPWYAFPALPLLPVLMTYYFDQPSRLYGASYQGVVHYFMACSFSLYLLMTLFLHFSLPGGGSRIEKFLHTPFMNYAGQKMTQQETLGKFNAFYPQAIDMINHYPTNNVFRVGTYLSYHIYNNDRRVFENNQLGFYGRVMNQVRRPEDFLRILKENDFKFVLYDLKSAGIDKTPDKSLLKKNQEFINLLLNSNDARLVLTDNIVEDPTGGKIKVGEVSVAGKSALIGNTLYPGTFALFELN